MHIEKNISLKSYNSFGIQAFAEHFCRLQNLQELDEIPGICKAVKSSSIALILGGGSNILLQADVAGLVVKNELKGIERIREDNGHVYVQAAAGENWHSFVEYCLYNNLAGVENLALIPGNVGASPMQNIGAYGCEIKDVFHSLDAFDLVERRMQTFDKDDCSFGYRESVFKNKYRGRFLITSVTYRLDKNANLNTSYGAIREELDSMKINQPTITDVAQAVMNIRRSKLPDPAIIGNAGSFFKNPEVTEEIFTSLQKDFPNIVGYPTRPGYIKLAAGWLIEQCGWKGYRDGDAGCHDKQALVLVNYKNATGAQIVDLSERIMQSVFEKFGVLLEREVNIIP